MLILIGVFIFIKQSDAIAEDEMKTVFSTIVLCIMIFDIGSLLLNVFKIMALKKRGNIKYSREDRSYLSEMNIVLDINEIQRN